MSRKRKAWIGYPPTHKSFNPYTRTIGQAALAWNGLHEAFRELFCVLMQGVDTPQSASVFYSLRSDRSQRQMIKAAAKSAFETGELPKDESELIGWLLKEADKLAEARDDIVHAPLISSISPDNVYPFAQFGHPRAKNLSGKDLLTEFRWCRDTAITLADFCIKTALTISYGREQFPLPETPSLPNRGQKNSRQHPQSRQSRPKSQRPQPRSSGE